MPHACNTQFSFILFLLFFQTLVVTLAVDLLVHQDDKVYTVQNTGLDDQ